MNTMSSQYGYALLLCFGAAMIAITTMGSRDPQWKTRVGFLAAGRKVNWWLGAFSIAVSWIWAPALFVSVQQAYQQGIPGIFWFTFPNVLCLFIMAPLALRIRRRLPDGFTQPEWIRYRLGERAHAIYLVPFFWYQLMAVTVQLYAGGSIFSLLSGVPVDAVMVILAATTLAYAVISGMRASIITDFLQYAVIVVGGLLVIPWTLVRAGGWSAVSAGLGGLGGAHPSLLDPSVAFNFGVVTTIGLISGVLSDQQHWQRAFAIEQRTLRRSYVAAGLCFGIVPLGLALLGFLGANQSLGISLPQGVDPSMIGVVVISHYLPVWAVATFAVMLLCGLCSTLDSGLLAAGSLYSINCFRYSEADRAVMERAHRGELLSSSDALIREELDRRIVRRSRHAMVGITIAGLAVALAVQYIPGFGLKYLWWVFNTIAACVAVPTVLSLYWDRLDGRGVVWGVSVAFCVGVPLFIYANAKDMAWLTVASSVGIVAVSSLFCLLLPRKSPFVSSSVHAGRSSSSEKMELQA